MIPTAKDFATGQDIAEVKQDIANVRQDIAELRTEIAVFKFAVFGILIPLQLAIFILVVKLVFFTN